MTTHSSAMEAAGRVGAALWFDGRMVRLTRKRRGLGTRGEREIPVGQIAAVEWRDAGIIGNGFIRFVVAGVQTPRGRFGSQTTKANMDEWAVPFSRKQQPQFVLLRDAIRAAQQH